MNVVGSLGEARSLLLLDIEHYGTISGNSLSIYHISRGPKDFIWFANGISAITSHVKSQLIAVAPVILVGEVEVMDYQTQNIKYYLSNPTGVRLLSLSFSYEADRVVGISDFANHSVLCWSVGSSQLLICSRLETLHSQCLFNPCDHDSFVLFGKEFIQFGKLDETLGNFSCELESATGSNVEIQNRMNPIKFLVWLPSSVALLTDIDGVIYSFYAQTKSLQRLGRIENPRHSSAVFIPSAALVTLTHLVVGSMTGDIVWININFNPLVKLRSDDIISSIIQLELLAQYAFLGHGVCSMVPNLNFEMVLVSTTESTILQLPLLVTQTTNMMETTEDVTSTPVPTVNVVPMLPNSAVLQILDTVTDIAIISTCVKIPIVRTESEESYLECFVTSSFKGDITVWKIPTIEMDLYSHSTHRKATPEHFYKIKVFRPENRDQAVISALKFSVSSPSHRPVLQIGYSDGFFELWKLIVNECDDDESGIMGEHVGVFEDDGDLFRLDIYQSFAIRLYEEPLTFISVDKSGSYLALGSLESNEVYILKYASGNKYQVTRRLHISDTPCLQALVWQSNDSYLAAFLKTGKVCFFLSDFDSEKVTSREKPDLILEFADENMRLFGLTQDNVVVFHGFGSNSMKYLSLPPDLEKVFAARILPSNYFENIQQESILTCIEFSQNHKFFATGSVDGTISVYQINNENLSLSHLIHRHRPHSDAVISLSFSFDGGLLLSSSCDRSSFILKLEDSPASIIEIKSESAIVDTNRKITSNENKLTWFEGFQKEEIDRLKLKYADNVEEISETVKGIHLQVSAIVESNVSKEKVEQLTRKELVIDVLAEATMKKETEDALAALKQSYANFIALNELIAARVRKQCFDTFESKASKLYPIPSAENNMDVTTFITSFPVRKLEAIEKYRLDRIKRLRAIELKVQRSEAMVDGNRKKDLKSSWTTSRQGCPSEISWVVQNGKTTHSFNTDGSQLITGKEDEDDVSVSSDDSELNFQSLSTDDLLYSPFSIRTQVQKRTQLFFLKEVDQILRKEFNSQFEALHIDKEDAIAAINSRHGRLQEILADLRLNESLTFYQLRESEFKETNIRVKNEELFSRPYETEAGREKRLAEEEEKRQKEEENSRQDIKGRALQEMMNGVLEAKKNIFLESSELEKPSWMNDIVPADMTEFQLQQYEEYEAKLKLLTEEKLKYKKSLEQEMKKLKLEVAEIIKTFNDRFSTILEFRLLINRDLLIQELFGCLVANSMISREYKWYSLMKLKNEGSVPKAIKLELSKRIKSLTAYMEDLDQRINASKEAEKNLDKTFKRDISELCNTTFDQETLRVLSSLYKVRQYPSFAEDSILQDFEGSEAARTEDEDDNRLSSKASRNSRGSRGSRGSRDVMGKTKNSKNISKRGSRSSDGQQSKIRMSRVRASKGNIGIGSSDVKDMNLGPMQEAARALKGGDKEEINDVFQISVFFQNKLKRSSLLPIPINQPLRMDADAPDGFIVEQFFWSKLQELRSVRIEKDINTRTLQNEYTTLQLKLEQLKLTEQLLNENLFIFDSNETCLKSDIIDRDSNLELLVKLKQGQDEVFKDASKIDYSEALLIPIDVINTYNRRITELGTEKRSLLSKIKSFRRKINLVNWEADHLDMLKKHLGEYFKDLQLLRVTKDLQQVLRDGCDPEIMKKKVEMSLTRKEFLKKDAETKLRQLQKWKDTLSKSIADRVNETRNLETNISSLRSQVNARKQIKQSRDAARGSAKIDPADLAAIKMKRVVSRKQLVDTAKSQAEEIDFLRQELDRLRQRTFPSFVRAVKKRINGVA